MQLDIVEYPITKELLDEDKIMGLYEDKLLIKKTNGNFYQFIIPQNGLNLLKMMLRGDLFYVRKTST